MSLVTGLENGCGMENGMNYGILKCQEALFHGTTRLCCVAICLLTFDLHSCILFEVLGVKGHLHIDDGCVLYLVGSFTSNAGDFFDV